MEHFRRFTGTNTALIVVGVLAVAAVTVMAQSGLPSSTSSQSVTVPVTVDTPQDESTETVTVEGNATAFAALNESHTVAYEEYASGYFVTGVDGLSQNDTHSWMYFVNGDVPSRAADRYVLDGNDSVTFRYMSNDAAGELVG